MNIKLSQKERLLLEDQKSHEEICIKKYSDYANKAQDPQLKQMFQAHAQHEQQHLTTINQILGGQLSAMTTQSQSQGQSGMQNQQQNQQTMQNKQQNQGSMTSGSGNEKDKDLCSDLLMTEKYVSSTYNTVIFECADTNVRQALNHIQKEEQKHGEDIFHYMQSHGMYTPQ